MSDTDSQLDFAAADEAEGADALTISLDGFEGPLHLLLELSRAKKFDLAKVSVTAIAEQYLAFIAEARARNIEVAGDYLVMAAWLTLLKSRLLLPAPQRPTDEPDADEMAAELRLKLMRLERARAAARKLEEMNHLGRDVFLNGAPEQIAETRLTVWRASLHDLLAAYCAERTKSVRTRAYRTSVRRAFPLESARKRLEEKVAALTEWAQIDGLAPDAEIGPDAPPPSSYLASTFAAALELAREHRLELRQNEPMAALYVRAKTETGALQEGAETPKSETT